MIWENTLSGMVDSTASRFDAASAYKKSDYVWYAATGVKPKLYKAKADMAAGAWDASKWEEIVVTTDFTNKDAVKTKNKTTYGAVEFDGNDLIIKRGKCYKYYTTDKTKMYHYGDFVSGYRAPQDAIDFIIPASIVSGYYLPWDQDDETDFDGALNWCMSILEEDPDTGEMILNPDGDFSQVPEGFLEAHYDSDEDADIPYKIHKDGTIEKLSADKMIYSLTAEEFQAKGYSVGDFMLADGAVLPGGETWQPTTGIQYVEPSPVKTTVMDLVTLQDELAPTWEELDDKHYGSLFYYNYELYALMAIDEEYDGQLSDKDSVIFPNMRKLTDLGDHVWANKITTLENLVEIGSRQSGYTCTRALIFNLFSTESTLKVQIPSDACLKINGGLGQNAVSTFVDIDLRGDHKYIDVDWDLHGEQAKISFETNDDETWGHEPVVQNFNIRNGTVEFGLGRVDIEYDADPYYYLAECFQAENATVEVKTACPSIALGQFTNVFKNCDLFYYCTGDVTTSRKCYIKTTDLENCYMVVGKIDGMDATDGFERVGTSSFSARNSKILFNDIRKIENISGEFTNCTIECSFWTDGVIESTYFIYGPVNYCDISVKSRLGGTNNPSTFAGKYIIGDGNSRHNCVRLQFHLDDAHAPTGMFAQGGWHIGNTLETLDGIKYHDYPTT